MGVDVNTASPALLRYVSGLNQLTARRMYEFRCQHGPFRNRQQLREVPGFGEATFVQAAGFLKISSGENPLDATWIHPESYAVASRVLERLDAAPAALTEKDGRRCWPPDRRRRPGRPGQGVGSRHAHAQGHPGPVGPAGTRSAEDLPPAGLQTGRLKLEDLAAGMELTGTVLNVVDFGCFVDIGMHDSGLVHVSHLADRFIRDPHEVVAVGDIVKVWVLAVDKERRRVSLTMVAPGSQRPRPPRGGPPAADGAPAAPGEGQRRDRRHGRRQSEGQSPAAGPAPQAEQRRQGPPPSRPEGPPPHGGRPQGRPPQYQQPRPRPKPLIPITDAMKIGKEPMRTFGDLMQFFEQKKTPGDNKESKHESKPGSKEDGGPARLPATPPAATEAATAAQLVETATAVEGPPVGGPPPQAEAPAAEDQTASSPEPIAAETPPAAEEDSQQLGE